MTHLPDLSWHPTTAYGQRKGSRVERVVVHRWGVRYTTEPAEAKCYAGVIAYFQNPANRASAHFVYPGSAVPNECAQMVEYAHYAWAEAAYNPTSVEVESADAIWTIEQDGKLADEAGFAQLARIVAFLLHKYGLPAVWSDTRGFCRHADLGAAGGGHTECPCGPGQLALWRRFVHAVQREHELGGFRPHWGR